MRRRAAGLIWSSLIWSGGLLLLAGCHHQPAAVYAPPAPVLLPSTPPANAPPNTAPAIAGSAPIEPSVTNPGVTSAADLAFVASHTPVWSETGTASWYGPPYNKRRGANGQIFDQDAMTAAHRTLPLNSLIRVTNLKTGQQAVLHVTDRGPFVPGRVLDLSLASDKARRIALTRPEPSAGQPFSAVKIAPIHRRANLVGSGLQALGAGGGRERDEQ